MQLISWNSRTRTLYDRVRNLTVLKMSRRNEAQTARANVSHGETLGLMERETDTRTLP